MDNLPPPFLDPSEWGRAGRHWVLVGPLGAVGLLPLHLGHALAKRVDPSHLGGPVLLEDAGVALRWLRGFGGGI